MPGSLNFCLICETIGNGKCIKNGTICQCLDGYSGETCLDSTEVTLFETTTILQKDTHIVNVSAVILGALAGFLCILIIGLVILFFLRKKNKQKELLTIPSSTSCNTIPALYNIPLSQRNSYTSSMTYHVYEDLP
ncbi:unnamed protein product [Rotaria sp. Silwood1]|nr:unnamed protein product [Rotaria sp. Silwood1]CAF4970996.1 unnamed protein product [Rotaria sp. Silwood1]